MTKLGMLCGQLDVVLFWYLSTVNQVTIKAWNFSEGWNKCSTQRKSLIWLRGDPDLGEYLFIFFFYLKKKPIPTVKMELYNKNKINCSFRLRLFRHFDPFRILVCSGDGSVGWVLSEIDRLGMHVSKVLNAHPII